MFHYFIWNVTLRVWEELLFHFIFYRDFLRPVSSFMMRKRCVIIIARRQHRLIVRSFSCLTNCWPTLDDIWVISSTSLTLSIKSSAWLCIYSGSFDHPKRYQLFVEFIIIGCVSTLANLPTRWCLSSLLRCQSICRILRAKLRDSIPFIRCVIGRNVIYRTLKDVFF